MNNLGKTNDEAEYNAALVQSNGRIYCAIPVDHDATHPIEDMLKTRPHCPIQQDATIVQYKPWDKQAKCIDRIALILMPSLFSIVAAIYWSTYLYIGYVSKCDNLYPTMNQIYVEYYFHKHSIDMKYFLLFQTKLSIKVRTSKRDTYFKRYNEFDYRKLLNIVPLILISSETVQHIFFH